MSKTNQQQQQQQLVPIISSSTTESDEDDDASTVASSKAEETTTGSSLLEQDSIVGLSAQQKGDAMAYLLRYETMVRQQEAEDMAVLAHIRPCVNRLLELIGQKPVVAEDLQFLAHEISFVDLQKAVRKLEHLQKHQQHNNRPIEHLTTDRQLMMVLRLLTQKVDKRATNNSSTTATATTMITWAEVVQCYKVCIAGMLTLQHLPHDTAIRARARDRTLAMLSLFESPSTQLFHEDASVSNKRSSKKYCSAPLTKSRSATAATTTTTTSVPWNSEKPQQLRWFKRKTRRFLLVLTAVVVACSIGWWKLDDKEVGLSDLVPSSFSNKKHPVFSEPMAFARQQHVFASQQYELAKMATEDFFSSISTTSASETFEATAVEKPRWVGIDDPFTGSAQGISSIVKSVLHEVQGYSRCLEQQCDGFD